MFMYREKEQKPIQWIRDKYPKATEDELQEYEDNFRNFFRYLSELPLEDLQNIEKAFKDE